MNSWIFLGFLLWGLALADQKSSKRPRTAILLSGVVRLLNETFPSIHESLVLPNNADIFAVLTLDDVNTRKGDKKGGVHGNDAQAIVVNLEKEFTSLRIVNITETGEEAALKNNANGRALMALHGVYRANELKRAHELQQGFVYDWVMRVRPDMLVSPMVGEFHMGEHLASIVEPGDLMHTIATPFCANYGADVHPWRNFGLNDQVALGRSAAMNKYAEAYQVIRAAFQNRKNLAFQYKRPEFLLRHAVDTAKLTLAPLVLLPHAPSPPPKEWVNCTSTASQLQKWCEVEDTGYMLCRKRGCAEALHADVVANAQRYAVSSNYRPRSCLREIVATGA